MTMLSNVEIREAIESGEIRIEPFRPENVQPASYDVTLLGDFQPHYTRGIEFHEGRNAVDPLHPYDSTSEVRLRAMLPGHYLLRGCRGMTLACVNEELAIPASMAVSLTGKSSIARYSVVVHLTAGHCDPGYQGRPTLEMVNNGPDDVLLTVGMDIAQLVFYRLGKPADPPYQGRYQHATGTQASKYHEGRGS